MVNPSWGSFQKPNQSSEPEQEKEIQQEFQGNIQDSEKTESEKPQWGDFKTPTTYQGEPDPTAEEGWGDYIARNTTSNASRLLEQGFGRYGNIQKFAKDAVVNNPMLGGAIGWAVSELVGPEKWEKIVRGDESKTSSANLPTSEHFKKASEFISGGYTKPKTPGEKRFQEFTEDVGSTISGRSIRNPTARNIGINNLLIPAAANVTKQIVQELGFGEDIANMAKMTVWLPTSLLGNVNGPQYASELMNRGRQGMPANLTADIPRLQRRIQAVRNNPTFVSTDPRTALARKLLNSLERDIANGQTSQRSLMTIYDGINAAKRNRKLFELGSPGDVRFARRAIDNVLHAVRDEIREVGRNHPEALANWNNGLGAWGAIHKSNQITEWVKDVAKGPYAKILSGPAAALFGIGSLGASKAPIVAGTTAALVPATYKSGQILYRMANNQTLANYYWNAIGAANAENIPAFINNYNKLNKELQKTEKSVKASKVTGSTNNENKSNNEEKIDYKKHNISLV